MSKKAHTLSHSVLNNNPLPSKTQVRPPPHNKVLCFVRSSVILQLRKNYVWMVYGSYSALNPNLTE